jgi:hypothetical protein
LTPPADVPVGAGFTLPINLLVYVDGGQPGASDALVVAGFDGVNATALPATDFAVVNHGLNPGEGVVRIFRDQAGAGNEPFQFPDIVYTGVEVVSPFVSNNAAGDPQLLILGPDAYEQNEFRTTAAFLGSGDTINVTNLSIFPNAFEHRFVVADADFFRVVARHTGTLDVQVYFREVNEFLPGEGDLNIFAFDSTGDAITGFGTNETAAGDNDADERIRIPVVAGQTYFIQVVGRLATTVNGYDMTIINEPPPTPFDLEVDDVIARSTVTSFFNTTTTFNGSAALSAVDDFYNGKFVEFVFPSTVGVTGQRAVVLDYIGATRTFILAAPIAAAPFFGDTFQIESNDTGRSQLDNYTRDNTPTVIIRLDDAILLNDLPGNGATDTPPDQVIPIPFVASTAVNPQGMPGYRVAVFDEADTNNPVFLGYAQPIAGLPGNYTFTFVTPLADGSHFISARVQMIDPATPNLNGFGPRSLSFELVVDTRAPAAFFGQANVLNDGLHPSSEAGVNGQPATFIDNKTNDTTPTFFGVAEANSIIRLYADTNFNNTVDATDVPLGLTVTLPYDGTNQFPFGQWTLTSTVDLNNPLFFPFDGLRRILVTAEDLAGNVSTVAQLPDALNIFIDTQGPQVFDPDGGGPLSGVHLLDDPATPFVNESFFDLFDPKPTTQGPTPPVTKLAIRFRDLPARVAGFLNPALNPIVAVTPGHYELRGDQVGVIPIMSVTFFQDPVVAGFPATGTVVLMFFTPLPDDRYTLTVRDELVDDVGNQLDGESNAIQPLEMPLFPTGDGVPGGDFVARFTVDTRPEIATYAGGQVYVDTNGNFVFDPEGQDNDAVNKDIVYNFGAVSDALFTGKFLAPGVAVPPGTRIFDQLAAYGLFGGVWRFLIDTNSNGVINVAEGDIVANNPFANNALPFAGNWDGNVTNGDEVGLFNGTTWFLDTNHDFIVDRVITGTMAGYPIAGDFDGDGTDDLGTFQNDTFFFDLANNGLFGIATAAIGYGFPGVGERPLAADMDQDGIDDIGLWFPGAQGQPPAEAADWYFLISNDRAGTNRVIGSVNTLNHAFQPVPFGADIFAQFGDEVALPLVGNFDPPVAADSTVDAWVANTNDAIVVAPGPGMEPRIQVFDRHTGQLLDSLLAYAPGFDAGVQVATGDVTGDGVLDIITGAGYGGGPHVRVFDGATGQPVATAIGNFYAYHPAYTGGIFVASADVNRDGRADIVTGTGFGGGPHIRVFSGRDGSVLGEFMAYHPAYTGGVHIGVGDVDGNGFPDIITAPAFDGGPHVKIFSTPQGQIMPGPLGNFMVYSPAFTGGVWVAAGDIDGDRRADLITGAGAGGGPHVRAFRSTDGGVLQSFFAYDGAFTGGVRVAAVDVNYDGRADLVTGPGMGGGPHVRAFDGQTHDSPMSLFAYDAGFTGGVYVAGSLFGVPGSALLAAGGGVESTADSVAASQDEVDLLAAAAIARWSATGLSQDQVDRLRGVSIRIADLPGAHLGVAYEDEILIDIDAAGHGWFVDATPEADEEFLLDSYGNLRLADPALSGRMDLLTVLAHEMGHVLGLEDIDLYGDASELMGDELSTALRRDVPGSETDSVDLVFQSGLWE